MKVNQNGNAPFIKKNAHAALFSKYIMASEVKLTCFSGVTAKHKRKNGKHCPLLVDAPYWSAKQTEQREQKKHKMILPIF